MKLTFPAALCLLFIGLKLGGIITWSWWWVLAPLLWPLYIVLAIIVGCFIKAVWETRR